VGYRLGGGVSPTRSLSPQAGKGRQPLALRRRGEGRARDGRVRGRASAGFTLIEVLVVLVLTALITGILLLAFERVLDIRVRLAAFLEGTDVPTLIAGWFRGSVDGLLPDAKDGADQFSGTARRFAGLSVAPIAGMAGVPTRISWELAFEPERGRTYLRYRSGDDQPMTVASWPGDLGSLRYCAPDLSCYDSWPPPLPAAAQLPSLIRLNAVRGTEFWPILAAPRADRDPLPKIPNLFRAAQ
jgi:general secretion pathway protein J